MILLACFVLAQADTLVANHAQALDGDRATNSALAAWGGAAIVAGVTLAAAKRDDKQWLTFGLFTAAVGAVNVGFSVLGLVQEANERKTLAAKLQLDGDALRDYQQELVARHRGAATIYALNFGLDVSYVAAGVILWVVGERLKPNPILHGMGMAGVIQGAYLFISDFLNWLLAEQRGAVVARYRFSF